MSDAAKIKLIEEALLTEGSSQEQAHELAATLVSDGLKYLFTVAELETSAFFSVRPRGGAIHITLNALHPAYSHLMEVLEPTDEDKDSNNAKSLKERLDNALAALKLVLMAWARFEDEQQSDKIRIQIQDIRSDWGRVARQFLETEE